MGISQTLTRIMESIPDARYMVQYLDHKENEWTAPVKLTPERIERITSDASVSKIWVQFPDGNIKEIYND